MSSNFSDRSLLLIVDKFVMKFIIFVFFINWSAQSLAEEVNSKLSDLVRDYYCSLLCSKNCSD